MPQPGAVKSDGDVSAAYASALIDTAYRIRETYGDLLKQRTANREALRQMRVQGHLSAEQVKEVDELYPIRKQAKQKAEESDAAKTTAKS